MHKYRPFKTSDFIGQFATRKLFENYSKNRNFSQSNFLIGPSGTGKTSMALMIAALLQCKSPILKRDGTSEPCGKCDSCIDLREERFSRDVKFYDGSDLGIEEMKKIEDSLIISPLYDKNRIIIFDEAQNISGVGKRKFLHMIEEKRNNVYFIINTMSPEIFDDSILSRGQKFVFQHPTVPQIAEYLLNILKKEDPEEKIPDSFVSEGLFLISEICKGNIREALSCFETCVQSEIFTNEEISKYFNVESSKNIAEILLSILKKDSSVFEHLLKINVKDFFYQSFDGLTEGILYKRSKSAAKKVYWRENLYKQLSKIDDERLTEVLNIYNHTYENANRTYFNDTYFISKILEIM